MVWPPQHSELACIRIWFEIRKWIQFSSNLQRKLSHTLSWADFLWSRAKERDTLEQPAPHFLLRLCLKVCVHLVEQTSREFKWAEVRHFSFSLRRDPCVRMSSNSKSVNSTAIKAEIKRHESLQSAINRLSKQFERVADQQLRSGLKVYLHSIQGKRILSGLSLRKKATYYLWAKVVIDRL